MNERPWLPPSLPPPSARDIAAVFRTLAVPRGLAAGGYRVAGIFLSGMNEERITQAYQRFKPGRDFLRIPIFLNSGMYDIVATPEQQNAVEKSMRRTGFENIRHTSFPGGHELPPTRLREGLRWLRKGL